MNEFIEQFIIESREHIEQATAALLTLEGAPHDTQALDELFRALHTLKGSAGIIDFAAMERLLHAVETALTHAKSQNAALSGELNADCLSCLDLIVRWLDAMEQSGDLPASAEAQAALLLARLNARPQANVNDASVARAAVTADTWLERMLAQHEALQPRVRTAIRYTPKRDSFFRGEDPLALMAALPGLLALDLQPDGAWPVLDTLDPYESFLVLIALTAASAQEIELHLKDHAGECEILEPGSRRKTDADSTLAQSGRAILEAQIALLDEVTEGWLAGHVASAGTTASNTLACCGLPAMADLVARATAQSLAEKNPGPLRARLVQALDNAAEQRPAPSASPARAEGPARTLRVDAARIESLVRLIGELTVVKNALGHLAHLAQAEVNPIAVRLKDQQGVLDRITGEVQRTVLGMRVLPLRTVLGRFPPVVREMAASLGKPAKLIIEGDETEADKAIVELLFEPLLHIVRNAMDHGLESPGLRAQSNKPAIATLVMRAAREGDRVLIEVADDGSGIDVARVRQVALQRGIVTPEGLAELTEAEIVDLVFAPGFSTATTVTELSGRGVGMDAVRTAVGRIGGTVAIDSRPGQGTTVAFSLPFSVMMTQVMTVEAGGQTFGIPLDAVIETVRVPVHTMTGIGAAHAIVHRNRTLPVFELAALLQVREPLHAQTPLQAQALSHAQTPLQVPAPAPIENEAIIVVTSFAGQWGGIRVDRLGARMEVMLKPLEGLLSAIPGITGTTIMGDGRVLLVLDMGAILL